MTKRLSRIVNAKLRTKTATLPYGVRVLVNVTSRHSFWLLCYIRALYRV